MTAEVVVMNREAVAMAADSAVTVGTKIYQTGNKVFSLSKIFPIGIMISNAAHFMEVPWETVVKMYREATIKETEKDTVADYCNHFLASICNRKLCSADQQAKRVIQIVTSHLLNVGNEARNQWLGRLISEGRCSSREKGRIVKSLLSSYRNHLRSFPDYPFQSLSDRTLVRRYKSELELGIDQALGELELTNSARSIAYQCAKMSILKNAPSAIDSTLAIAGFGGNEFFPSLEIVQLDGVIADEIKITSSESHDIDRKGQIALVRPLAQREMVHRFMEGVDETYQEVVETYFENFCLSLGMNRTQAAQVRARFQTDMKAFRNERFSQSIIRNLVNLPKHDMARMAESLVSLTSQKRRVSEELETVADPIDVAVISKGDGLIWIKRKHYFSSDLNPHFGQLYLRKAWS